MATKKSTSTPAPETRRVPLADVRILELIYPDGSEEKTTLDPPMNPAYALALERSITWTFDQQTQASLRDPVELVDMVGTLGNLIKDLGTSGDKDEPMGEAEADEVVRVAAFCQQILLGFLRIAHKTDAELAARFAVLIGGAA